MSSPAPEATARIRLAVQNGQPVTPPPGPPVLRLTLGDMRYGSAAVLGRLSLEVRSGEVLALTGPSGIGKSTLLRIIAGLETRYTGNVVCQGRIAMVFQEPVLLRWRTALDNITLTAQVSEVRARAALADVGLAGRATALPDQLSLGQQRRLALARAFAAAPDLMLLDEPFVSLDPELAQEMMDLFERLRAKQGAAALLVSHAVEEVSALAHRVVTLGGSPARITQIRDNPLRTAGHSASDPRLG